MTALHHHQIGATLQESPDLVWTSLLLCSASSHPHHQMIKTMPKTKTKPTLPKGKKSKAKNSVRHTEKQFHVLLPCKQGHGQLVGNKPPTQNAFRPRSPDQSDHSPENPFAEEIPPAEGSMLSKSLSYQLKVVNIDYLRDFHAQEAN